MVLVIKQKYDLFLIVLMSNKKNLEMNILKEFLL